MEQAFRIKGTSTEIIVWQTTGVNKYKQNRQNTPHLSSFFGARFVDRSGFCQKTERSEKLAKERQIVYNSKYS